MAKKSDKYSKEHCKNIALFCKSRKEFRESHRSEYLFCLRNGWIEEVCSHFELNKALPDYWNVHYQEAISQCDTRHEMFRRFPGAFYFLKRSGLFEKYCSCLAEMRYDINRLSEEDLIHVAKKYNSLTDFAKYDGAIFNDIHRRGLLYTVCSHLINKDYINEKIERISTSLEDESNELNELIAIARSCSDFTEFRKEHGNAYCIAINKEWIDMVSVIIPEGSKFDLATIAEHANSCNSLSEFKRKYTREYLEAEAMGYIDQIRNIFNEKNNIRDYSLETVLRIASKCSSYKEFRYSYSNLYFAANRRGWLPKVKELLPKEARERYSKDQIIELAKKYENRKSFIENEPSAYNAARHNKWMDEINSILPVKVRKPYERQEIIEIAKTCPTYSDFLKYHKSVYLAAKKLGLIDEIKTILK